MKRFTETTIWDLEWFKNLLPEEKSAWFFLKDKCDAVGVWKPNFGSAEAHIGTKVNWDEFLDHINGNIEVLENGKWWIVDFCEFQYGKLKATCAPHNTYKKMLLKHGLYDKYLQTVAYLQENKGYYRGTIGVQEKEKEKELEYINITNVPEVKLTKQQYDKLIDYFGKKLVDDKILDLQHYIVNGKGKKYSDHYLALRNFFRRDHINPKSKIESRKCERCGRTLYNSSGICTCGGE